MNCEEYVGPATGTGWRRRCEQHARWLVHDQAGRPHYVCTRHLNAVWADRRQTAASLP